MASHEPHEKERDVSSNRFQEYMAHMTTLFGDDLHKIHSGDANPETLQQLSSCIEAGLAVWDYPLRIEPPEQ